MNNIGYIYKITNLTNNKIYIGKTKTTIEQRFRSHIYSSKKFAINNKGKRSFLYVAMNRDGVDNFVIEMIEKCPIELLDSREIYWINALNSRDRSIGYNICKGGEAGPGGPMFAGHKNSGVYIVSYLLVKIMACLEKLILMNLKRRIDNLN